MCFGFAIIIFHAVFLDRCLGKRKMPSKKTFQYSNFATIETLNKRSTESNVLKGEVKTDEGGGVEQMAWLEWHLALCLISGERLAVIVDRGGEWKPGVLFLVFQSHGLLLLPLLLSFPISPSPISRSLPIVAIPTCLLSSVYHTAPLARAQQSGGRYFSRARVPSSF